MDIVFLESNKHMNEQIKNICILFINCNGKTLCICINYYLKECLKAICQNILVET